MPNTPIETQLQAFDRAILTGFVRQSLNSETLEIDEWHVQPLHNATGIATGGVYRVAGVGREQDGGREWSLILKVVRLTQTGRIAGEDMAHALYWKREALAYQSDLLADLPEGLSAPRCFRVVEREGEMLWLWLEDVRDSYGWRWPLELYVQAARLLGHFNGAYLTTRPMPEYPWLTGDGSLRAVLEAYVGLRAVVRDPHLWQHPLLRSAFPVPLADRLVRLWDDRGRLLDVFERLPQTLCHLDAWRGNLFAPRGTDGGEQMVLLDWAYVGRGTVGTGAGDLAGASYGMLGIEECRSEEHTSELQSRENLVCRLLLEKKKKPRCAHVILSAAKNLRSRRANRPAREILRCAHFFFNDPGTTEIYTLSLHDALPILSIRSLICRRSFLASGSMRSAPP